MRVRGLDNDEGQRLLRIVRRGTGSVTWRRALDGTSVRPVHALAKIAEVTFTSADRVRDVIHNFNTDGSAPLPEIPGRPVEDVCAARAARDQEDRQVQAG